MKQTAKRLLSVILALILSLSVMTAGAWADNEENITLKVGESKTITLDGIDGSDADLSGLDTGVAVVSVKGTEASRTRETEPAAGITDGGTYVLATSTPYYAEYVKPSSTWLAKKSAKDALDAANVLTAHQEGDGYRFTTVIDGETYSLYLTESPRVKSERFVTLSTENYVVLHLDETTGLLWFDGTPFVEKASTEQKGGWNNYEQMYVFFDTYLEYQETAPKKAQYARLYEVEETEASAEISISGVAAGVTSFTVGGTTYRIAVQSTKISLPGLEKWIVDGDEQTKSASVGAGDTVSFRLDSNVPESLAGYVSFEEPDEPEIQTTSAEDHTYTLTFRDSMDAGLTVNGDSVAVQVNGKALESGEYELTVSGNSLTVQLELVALYEAGYFTAEEFGVAPITVEYMATAADSLSAGVRYNAAQVTYEEGESTVDKVALSTYGIRIFKYDQSTQNGLVGAEFELRDSDGKLVSTLVSGTDGIVLAQGLKAGSYTLKETKAPEGYVKSGKILTVTLPEDASGETLLATVNFANTSVPQTGDNSALILRGAGLAVFCGAVALLILVNGKRRKKA